MSQVTRSRSKFELYAFTMKYLLNVMWIWDIIENQIVYDASYV